MLQPANLKDPEFINELEELGADLFVVVAFRMLPEAVWNMPPKGTINLHASLLPNYRGAAPINWAIINGESKTGVTTFFIEKEIDTGKIIDQSETSIDENETVGELYARLMEMGAELMSSTIHKIANDEVDSVEQDEIQTEGLKEAPKIFKSDCEIDFSKPVNQVHNFCRGLSPYPTAWCTLYNKEKNEQKTFKIFSTRITDIASVEENVILSDTEGILFPTSNYYLRVTELQPEGKRRMSFQDFLAGNSIESWVIRTS